MIYNYTLILYLYFLLIAHSLFLEGINKRNNDSNENEVPKKKKKKIIQSNKKGEIKKYRVATNKFLKTMLKLVYNVVYYRINVNVFAFYMYV